LEKIGGGIHLTGVEGGRGKEKKNERRLGGEGRVMRPKGKVKG